MASWEALKRDLNHFCLISERDECHDGSWIKPDGPRGLSGYNGNMVRVQKLKLGAPEPNDWAARSAAERLDAVWQLTRTAYAFKMGDQVDARLSRHVARIVRHRR